METGPPINLGRTRTRGYVLHRWKLLGAMKSVFDRPPRYRAYLLRFWEERGQQGDLSPVWRFSLEDPYTGERYGFANLEEMVTFLRCLLENAGKKTRHWKPVRSQKKEVQ